MLKMEEKRNKDLAYQEKALEKFRNENTDLRSQLHVQQVGLNRI